MTWLMKTAFDVLCPLSNKWSIAGFLILQVFELDWPNLLLLKCSGNNEAFKFHILKVEFPFPSCLLEKMTVAETLPWQVKPLELLSSCLSLKVFI
jgi:hypothetical protein